MRHALQWLRSLVFIVLMYLGMAVLGIGGLPYALISRRRTRQLVHLYTSYVRWIAAHVAGLRSEIRGIPPRGDVVIAAKHQSFFDIILIWNAVPHPKFIMKAELRWAPILGFYALRTGCIPVNRGKRAQAIATMKQAVADGIDDPGQLVIYPQGTRIAPGVKAPYKIGAGVLYEQLGQPCVPAATNVGVFWPKRGIMRRQGVAVVEFLPEIEAGRPVPALMAELERVIEAKSDELIAEARASLRNDG